MFRRLLQQLVSPPRPATARPAVGHVPAEIRFKVIVADFYDRVSSSGGEKLAELLQGAEGLDVASLKADFDLSFLNFESRNFFDLIDRGQNLLEKTGADVLIWGCREENRLRLNFQTPRQYEKEDGSFVCLLDSMYLSADALAGGEFPQPLLDLLTGTVVSAADRPDKECRIYKKYLLKKIIARISKIDSAKSLGLEYMPYIMNQLGLIYMTAAADGKNENDFKIIANLFETALKYQKQIFEPTHLGCIYLHLGQLNDCASVYADKHSDVYFRAAIADYRQAQKYFGKYTYPYDHGHICYKLSGLYYNYWKRTEDLQALRDSVSQLRECERIFTQAQFPGFWGHIEGSLGYLLHNLGHRTRSPDICRLAVAAYRNQQKIVTENRQPLYWARIQQKIAETYYLEGKISANREALEEALACYHDALYIFETAKRAQAAEEARTGIAKTRQMLAELAPDAEEEETEDFTQP